MSQCKYPQHHSGGPSIFQPVALLIVIGIVAIVVAHWRAVVACIVIAGVLMVVAAVLMTLARNHRRYYDPELERQAALEQLQAPRAATASVTAAQSPAGVPAASTAAIEAAPAVVHNHQHLHLHGLSGGDLAAITRTALTAPEERHQ